MLVDVGLKYVRCWCKIFSPDVFVSLCLITGWVRGGVTDFIQQHTSPVCCISSIFTACPYPSFIRSILNSYLKPQNGKGEKNNK